MSRKEAEFEAADAKERDPFREDDPYEKTKKKRRLFDEASGRPLNVNEAKLDFEYDDSHRRNIIVRIKLYRASL